MNFITNTTLDCQSIFIFHDMEWNYSRWPSFPFFIRDNAGLLHTIDYDDMNDKI
jgi:hypothetical protein